MNYKKCYLYGLKSKNKLLELLHIERKIYCKSSFINCKISPYISSENGEKRLIEAPDLDIKKIQARILRSLQAIDAPQYVYSGIKGKCYIDNAKAHKDKKYLYKIDISKFFPNISRNRVYLFYLNKLNVSPDVANILTNFSTINLDLKNKDNKTIKTVNQFMLDNDIKKRNHLITGSPLSCILSYYANIDMFDEIYSFVNKHKVEMTIYIDDMVFSSNNKFSISFREKILSIIKRYGYNVSIHKCKWYNKPDIKKVTGVILDKNGKLQVPNRLMYKIHNYIDEIKDDDKTNMDKLKGCLVVSSSINGKLEKYRRQLNKIKN